MELSSFFETKFRKLVAQLEKRLDSYIKNPKEEKKVHDIRTSLRRLDSLFPLLSKKNRKANKKRITEYESFFKANSRLRDYDIIIARLTSLSPDSGALVLALQRRKDNELKAIVRKAKALRKMGKITAQSINSEEIEARLDKVMSKLCKKIKMNLAPTLSDSKNIEQLHSLRKDIKKIRYILESLDSSSEKKYQEMISTTTGLALTIPQLEKVQDMLGDLHDSDITLEFLRSSKSKLAGELHAREVSIRESLYSDFVGYMKSTLAADGDSLKAI
ncbi:MAG TPA: CHAD domain-containing protein [Nitrososphaera sp.]|jgi:CHAD domain-containing protein|nr:CHAD domain-containing protein [Nitrososphaera sp.]